MHIYYDFCFHKILHWNTELNASFYSRTSAIEGRLTVEYDVNHQIQLEFQTTEIFTRNRVKPI